MWINVYDQYGYCIKTFEANSEEEVIRGVKNASGLSQEASMEYALRYEEFKTEPEAISAAFIADDQSREYYSTKY